VREKGRWSPSSFAFSPVLLHCFFVSAFFRKRGSRCQRPWRSIQKAGLSLEYLAKHSAPYVVIPLRSLAMSVTRVTRTGKFITILFKLSARTSGAPRGESFQNPPTSGFLPSWAIMYLTQKPDTLLFRDGARSRV